MQKPLNSENTPLKVAKTPTKATTVASPAGAATTPKRKTPTQALKEMGLRRPIDLALHLPMRYEDETQLGSLANALDGSSLQFEATVLSSEVQYQGRKQLIARVQQDGHTCQLRFFNFYPSLQKALSAGNRVRIRGELKTGFGGASMVHPNVKLAGGQLASTLTPVYHSVAGLTQNYLRKAIDIALKDADLSDTILVKKVASQASQVFIEQALSWSLRHSLDFLHHPTPGIPLQTLEDQTHPAWQRLKIEELLAQQLSQTQARLEREALKAAVLNPKKGDLAKRLLAQLPFALTRAQARAVAEITQDLAKPSPMHRLLQGDVGSGKTVVAAMAAAICMDSGYQCVLMAPTEILAQQHFDKLWSWLSPLGITVAWLTGSQKVKEKREMMALAQSGQAQLIVGTHAVIQEKVVLPKLGLAIIDEQHRFGVAQRLALRHKTPIDENAGVNTEARPSENLPATALEPHMLMMSATPIPRTLAMSYYADLNVSTLDELPPGRTPIVTRLLHESRRDDVISRIQGQLNQGRQVYWVCPLIEESEAIDLRNATETWEELSAVLAQPTIEGQEPPANRVGLLHSKMATQDKKAIMEAFSMGLLSVLVSTTVIEVGVDVPNASLMVIEHSERFGLSQLHQLRGRVGRGTAASACVLLYSTGDAPKLGEKAKARLAAMIETQDGFEIARRDLQIRGPGEILGERQSGAAMLRFANLETDEELLEWARQYAPQMLQKDPALAAKHIERWMGGKIDFLKA